jgi:hypothetical protein
MLSYQGGKFVPSYTASKHAVAGITKSFCNELAISIFRSCADFVISSETILLIIKPNIEIKIIKIIFW